MSLPQPPPAAAGQQQQQQYQLASYGPPSPTDNGPPSPQPPALVKFPSSTTTIAEEPEPESDDHLRVSSPTLVKSCDDKEKEAPEQVIITIHPTLSSDTVQQPEYPMPVRTNTHPHPRQSMSADAKPCNVWPARRFMQKQVMQKKTKWIIIKVSLALLFIVGAVAIGLGISKAAHS